tara:strand:+ start:551 stop:694 length:144 start_codon:yes stop_codon:yes gene_type:complete
MYKIKNQTLYDTIDEVTTFTNPLYDCNDFDDEVTSCHMYEEIEDPSK